MSPDLRGLNEKAKEEYPHFTDEQLAVLECEICGARQNVKEYKLIRRDGTEAKIQLCYLHLEESIKAKPDVKIIPLDVVRIEDLLEDVEKLQQPDEEKDGGDTLLI